MSRLGDLASILQEQQAVYAKMLRQEEEKASALMAGDTEALRPVMGAQQALLVYAKALEDKRVALCEAFGSVTLRELIESGEEYREALEPKFTQLSETVLSLKKLNARNQKLLETRLDTIRFMSEQLGLHAITYSKGVNVKA
ncbi:MAG: flagellar protein FlgN [Eubacteriales bacterium]|nr:flagellar protein FlgN [Christensenellaceae bacterium]MEA5065400.1 flagellar protein FlgN [Eubacteriales bacterium]